MSEPVCLQAEAPSPRKREHDAPKSKNPFILQASIITHAMLVFLAINSTTLSYEDNDLINTILSAAAGELDDAGLLDWLQGHVE